MACLDESDQRLKIIEIVVISHNSFAMIDDACPLIALQAVQQFLHTISAGELRESTGFDLVRIQSLAAAGWLAFLAAGYALVHAAAAHLAPLCVLAPGKLLKAIAPAAFAEDVLRT